MQNFRDLKVWQKSHQLTLKVYGLTKVFPKDELFGLTSQIRRASASIPANIAEGCGRGTKGELAQFLTVAAGSTNELDYHLLLAHDLKLIDSPTHQRLNDEVAQTRRMLTTFIGRLRNSGN